MSAELIGAIAIGAPATLVAVLTYLSSRTKAQDEKFRLRVGDLITAFTVSAAFRQAIDNVLAPLLERMSNIEEDIKEMKQNDRPKP